MATNTNYLKLSKAETTDEILKTLSDNNSNFEIIDAKASELDAEVQGLETSVSELEETVSRLEEGGTGGTGLIELEASTDNIVDFNTVTEAGIYIIKNATASTTANAPALGSSGDAIIEVGNKDNIIFQSVMTITNNGIPYHRQNSGGTWSSWLSTIATGLIRAGTLNSGMACNTPTADTHIANKAYVDTQIEEKTNGNQNLSASSITAGTFAGQVNANATAVTNVGTAQVRNITASTTDLTAGTSALATGDIYLVYE